MTHDEIGHSVVVPEWMLADSPADPYAVHLQHLRQAEHEMWLDQARAAGFPEWLINPYTVGEYNALIAAGGTPDSARFRPEEDNVTDPAAAEDKPTRAYRSEPALVEIAERVFPKHGVPYPNDDAATEALRGFISPSEVRINGMPLAVQQIRVHEVVVNGGLGDDVVMVSLTLFARCVVFGAEAVDG